MTHMLNPEQGEPVLLKELKDVGYKVWWGGKNDLIPGETAPEAVCTIRHDPRKSTLPFYGPDRSWRGDPEDDGYYSFYVGKIEKGSHSHYHDSDWEYVEAACDLIRNHDGDQPLCIYLPLVYPHPPYGVEDPWYSAITPEQLPPRKSQSRCGEPSILKGIREGQRLGDWEEARWTRLRAVYYGMCARVDHQFNLILEALKDAGLYDDTAAFFFSDHGDFTGDYGLVEKTQNTFEDCLVNVPFLIKPPKGEACQPRVSDALVELVDFTATVYDYAGITPDYDHFGRSLRSLVAGETDEHRDAVFAEGGRLFCESQAMELSGTSASNEDGLYWPRLRLQVSDEQPWHTKAVMCRTKTAKYVYRDRENDELYDLVKDPDELNNRIDDPSMLELKETLRERMLKWTVETADIVPHKIDQRQLAPTARQSP